MKIGITGTPGTGKTTVSEHLDKNVINLKDYATKNGAGKQNKLFEVDIDQLRKSLPKKYWIEGHLAHKLDLDYCIVLRTDPEILRERLSSRNYSKEKIRENVEAEAMDLILSEASKEEFPIYEINTTDESPGDTARKIKQAVKQKKERKGVVDWTDYF